MNPPKEVEYAYHDLAPVAFDMSRESQHSLHVETHPDQVYIDAHEKQKQHKLVH